MSKYKILEGDVRQTLSKLQDKSIQCVVTSSPYYGLRDYGVDGQIGLEQTPDEYVQQLVDVFREVRRVMKDDGTLWLNLGDSYARNPAKNGIGYDSTGKQATNKGSNNNNLQLPIPKGLKEKDLIGIPWRVAFALQADGWYLRQDIIWHKPNPMPESVKDRCTKAHEYIFLLTKSAQYYYDNEAIMEPITSSSKERLNQNIDNQLGSTRVPGKTNGNMKAVIRFGGNKYGDNDSKKFQTYSGNEYIENGFRNKRSVWTITTKPYKGAHFATFPMDLIEPCILAGSKEGDVVLDPFNGSGTTGYVAMRAGRDYVGCELNPEYIKLTQERFEKLGMFVEEYGE